MPVVEKEPGGRRRLAPAIAFAVVLVILIAVPIGYVCLATEPIDLGAYSLYGPNWDRETAVSPGGPGVRYWEFGPFTLKRLPP